MGSVGRVCGSGTGVGEEVFYWAERCGRGARGMKSICQELCYSTNGIKIGGNASLDLLCTN